jgi:hypothetical protein
MEMEAVTGKTLSDNGDSTPMRSRGCIITMISPAFLPDDRQGFSGNLV